MSYRISVEKEFLHLQFIGYVNGLQIMQVIADELFLPSLKKAKAALFDFSAAQDVDLSLDEVKSFGTIGKVESNFIDDLHIIIILSSERGRVTAEHYVNSVGCKNWQFDIVLDMEAAQQCINH